MSRLYLNDRERALVDKAIINFDSLTVKEIDLLIDMLGSYGMFTVPRKANIRQLLVGTARHQLLDQPAPFVEEMKLGIPPTFAETFFSILTLPAIDFLFKEQLPTPDKVQEVLTTDDEYLTQDQLNCLYYLNQFIARLDSDELGLFLQFVTGSSVMPDKITVVFNRLSGELRRPIAHTCSNTLELSITYTSSQEMKREFVSILINPLCFQMNMI